jgi:hypothetical protein
MTGSTSKAQGNAARIAYVLENRQGCADLYRTVTAGGSGQRADLLVARVRYTFRDPWELAVIDMTSRHNRGETAGYAARTDPFSAARHPGAVWTFWSWDDSSGESSLAGWASSLALGCDVLVNGVRAATGRHDFRRISGGRWLPYVPPEDSL